MVSRGDQNSTYFHNSIKQRRNMKRIISLVRLDGSTTSTEEEAKSVTPVFFPVFADSNFVY